MEKQRYNHLNTYLKEKLGERTLKISLSGGFTCPNRDGSKSTNGCLFCSNLGSGDHLDINLSITEQINKHLNGYRGTRANKFIAYFQNFSNTYAPLETLKQRYYEAINADPRIVALSVATRPDCINESNAKLLANINKTHTVWVELGLQTVNEKTAQNMNLCYTKEDFINAVTILNKYDICVVAHIMIGLPNENKEDVLNAVHFINTLPVQGVKFHSTYVEDNTGLSQLYKEGLYTPLEIYEYINILSCAISHLRPDIIVHRISGDAHHSTLLAPQWNSHKKLILNGLEKYLKDKNIFQGKEYKNS